MFELKKKALQLLGVVLCSQIVAGCATRATPTLDLATPGAYAFYKTPDGRNDMGYAIDVIAPWAEKCTVNDKVIDTKTSNQDFAFVYAHKSFGAGQGVTIACSNSKGDHSLRFVDAPLDLEDFRTNRTASTVGAAIATGGLALLTGPMASEMTKGQFKVVPFLIHMPLAIQGATNADHDAQREQAVTDWSKLREKMDKICPGKAGGTEAFLYGCNYAFYSLLRDEDLKVFKQ